MNRWLWAAIISYINSISAWYVHDKTTGIGPLNHVWCGCLLVNIGRRYFFWFSFARHGSTTTIMRVFAGSQHIIMPKWWAAPLVYMPTATCFLFKNVYRSFMIKVHRLSSSTARGFTRETELAEPNLNTVLEYPTVYSLILSMCLHLHKNTPASTTTTIITI